MEWEEVEHSMDRGNGEGGRDRGYRPPNANMAEVKVDGRGGGQGQERGGGGGANKLFPVLPSPIECSQWSSSGLVTTISNSSVRSVPSRPRPNFNILIKLFIPTFVHFDYDCA